MRYLITNAILVNEGARYHGALAIADDRIEKIYRGDEAPKALHGYVTIDAKGCYLLPGVIDDQVHFREPGLTHKADIFTESRAAVAGGVTSFMEMPNTIPPVLSQDLLEQKYSLAAEKSLANYSFYMGASNDNIEEVLKTDPSRVCGIKVFMGSSTGNMLVDDDDMLNAIFREAPCLIAVHCEDENIVKANLAEYKQRYAADASASLHPFIRSAEACYVSSSKAVELATRHGSRLHVLHLTTAKEMGLFRNDITLPAKKITSEVCLHHLMLSDEDYPRLGNRIKCNPAIKTSVDRDALRDALRNDLLDIVATDHAPHTIAEKSTSYFSAPSGMPMVQHLLVGLLQLTDDVITVEKAVEKLSHNPTIVYQIKDRGFLREGYYADLVIVNPDAPHLVTDDTSLYKCGWTPLHNTTLKHKVTHTFVNGNLVYDNGTVDENYRGCRLLFNR